MKVLPTLRMTSLLANRYKHKKLECACKDDLSGLPPVSPCWQKQLELTDKVMVIKCSKAAQRDVPAYMVNEWSGARQLNITLIWQP